ncbi:MAG: thioredoxin family protein [Acidobacteria bacterium]|nr:thioredoxin family protein [Acidobacteriota bacterium]
MHWNAASVRTPLAAAVVLAALAVIASPVSAAPGESTSAAFLGKEAPAFTLPDAEGKSHSLADTRSSKATVIIWVSTECPVSNAYNDRMAALAKEYQAKGFSFVGINSNKAETPAAIATHSKEHGFPFTVLKDADNVVADKYGASVTPEVYIVDSKGILRYHGRIDDNMKADAVTAHDLKSALDTMLAGQDLAKGESKAFGCSIKRVDKAGA